MYDTVRYILLGLLFASLLGVWIYSRRQAKGQGPLGYNPGSSFKVLQKRWVDQRTAVCLVEAEDQTFLLAYTAGGGVSWQPLNKPAADPAKEAEKAPGRLTTPRILPEKVS